MKFFLFLALMCSRVSLATVRFEAPFFFGIANAPAQVEDQLPDIWMDFVKTGKMVAFTNHFFPHDRLRFWSEPQVEVDLAALSGAGVFRMGVDWGRLMPTPDTFDREAFRRYHEIIDLIRARNMKIMLTLMHHSVPQWAQDMGGWTNPKLKDLFLKFSYEVIKEYEKKVEYWISFNEPNVFASHAYADGMWPPGKKGNLISMFALGKIRGKAIKALDRMAYTHNELYQWAHKNYPGIKMGVANNMGYYTSKKRINRINARTVDRIMNWRFPELTKGYADFYGINYYGAEWVKGLKIPVDPIEEYSEAGRAIYPDGLYYLLKEVYRRYKLPVIITENGIADETDILRPAYFIEHLMAVSSAQKEGVPVLGYIVWTLSDNLEWSDGYCPKFGMVAVDRANGFKRIPRESFYLFQKVANYREITPKMRTDAWDLVQAHVGEDRPFCRDKDGFLGLHEPIQRKIVKKDWRFGP